MAPSFIACVYERRYVYENLVAESPVAAQARIIGSHWAGDYADIARVEVSPQEEVLED